VINKDDILFDIETLIGVKIRLTKEYLGIITTHKHPTMSDKLNEVKLTLEAPEQIRRSKHNPAVYLFYRQLRLQRWVCAVIKRLNGTGFLVTTYITEAIKEGEEIWSK
jgi:hypothetical protein